MGNKRGQGIGEVAGGNDQQAAGLAIGGGDGVAIEGEGLEGGDFRGEEGGGGGGAFGAGKGDGDLDLRIEACFAFGRVVGDGGDLDHDEAASGEGACFLEGDGFGGEPGVGGVDGGVFFEDGFFAGAWNFRDGALDGTEGAPEAECGQGAVEGGGFPTEVEGDTIGDDDQATDDG